VGKFVDGERRFGRKKFNIVSAKRILSSEQKREKTRTLTELKERGPGSGTGGRWWSIAAPRWLEGSTTAPDLS